MKSTGCEAPPGADEKPLSGVTKQRAARAEEVVHRWPPLTPYVSLEHLVKEADAPFLGG